MSELHAKSTPWQQLAITLDPNCAWIQLSQDSQALQGGAIPVEKATRLGYGAGHLVSQVQIHLLESGHLNH